MKNVEFDNDNVVTVSFNNWAEVNDWWTANPTARRVSPEITADSIEEYNRINHNISFPTEMGFVFPKENN